tara:strand:- start:2078 stop:2881 length:804 start_codon:yes stop_codon:yes gene_type:complete
MSISLLPKELRLQIWTLAYFAEPPRLVTVRTKPHDEDHDERSLCPRYSPSPAPTVVNVCHEARAEAYYQARKAGHIVCLRYGPLDIPSREHLRFTEEFYFRFETDILHLRLEDEDEDVQHLDDSPEVGLLPHFRLAMDCDASLLRNIAITKVIWSGYRDGSLSNTLRMFPHISHMIMMVPEEVLEQKSQKPIFVRAVRRIVTLYKIDMRRQSGDLDGTIPVDVDFATLTAGKLAIVPRQTWRRWVSTDGLAQFYESMSWGNERLNSD